MKLLLETELYRIKKMMGIILEEEDPETEEECDKKRDAGTNCYWAYKKNKCITCPEGQLLSYPSEECSSCDPVDEVFVPGFGCEKICADDEYFDRDSGECEKIPPGKFYDGNQLQDIDEDILEFWRLENEKRQKEGKSILNPYEKPENEEDRKDWNEIFKNSNFFMNEDRINGEEEKFSIRKWNEQTENCLNSGTPPPQFPL